MFKKRGQAAMEFLMTYGWAILAAVIVVGVLWYMIGNPANLAGNSFQASAPFSSNGISIGADLGIEFRNGAGEDVVITDITAGTCSTAVGAEGVTVVQGALASYTLVCAPALTSGSKVAETVTISYTKGSGTLVQTATGTINGVVP
jgi:hypothetical protein